MTDTAVRLRRLGGPHARARAGAVLLASAGVACATAAAGLALAPRVAAVVAAWLLIVGIAAAVANATPALVSRAAPARARACGPLSRRSRSAVSVTALRSRRR